MFVDRPHLGNGHRKRIWPRQSAIHRKYPELQATGEISLSSAQSGPTAMQNPPIRNLLRNTEAAPASLFFGTAGGQFPSSQYTKTNRTFLVLTGSLEPWPTEAICSRARTFNFLPGAPKPAPLTRASWACRSTELPTSCSSALGHTGAAELGPLLARRASQLKFEGRCLALRINGPGRHLPVTKNPRMHSVAATIMLSLYALS